MKLSFKKIPHLQIEKVQIFIVLPDAKTLQQRVDTTKIAATDYSTKTGAKVVSVFLLPFKQVVGTGYNFAAVKYWSDGCGNSGTQCDGKQWNIRATDQQLTDLETKIAYEYYSNSHKFIDSYGLPDEEKLQAYIAKKLKIKVKDANLTMLFLDEIEYFFTAPLYCTKMQDLKRINNSSSPFARACFIGFATLHKFTYF